MILLKGSIQQRVPIGWQLISLFQVAGREELDQIGRAMKHVILCFLAGAVGLASGWAGPVIISQPQSQEVAIGSETVLSVGAEGGAGLTYQWLFNGVAIVGANGSTLLIDDVKFKDVGSYMVLLSDNTGATVSNVAQVTLKKPLVTGIERAVRIYFPTNTGKSYQVLVSGGLGEWKPMGKLIEGNGSEMEVFYVSNGKNFFRVEEMGEGAPPTEDEEFEDMIWIHSGTFKIGSPFTEKERGSDEDPHTKVMISRGFWMSKYEVTQEKYELFTGTNPSHFNGNSNSPVEMVNWHEAVAYCVEFTRQAREEERLPKGYEYRLPTEAEWEYACRAGTTTRFSYGNDPDYSQLGEYAWYSNNSSKTTHPVGQKKPNGWGLYDMHGNVWEWCLDWHGDYPGGSTADPQGPTVGTSCVRRGGRWGSPARYCRSATRDYSQPNFRHSGVGFRIVLALGL